MNNIIICYLPIEILQHFSDLITNCILKITLLIIKVLSQLKIMAQEWKQIDIQQMRKQIIRSYLFRSETNKKEKKGRALKKYPDMIPQELVKSANLETLEAYIKLFEYQQSQSYSNIKIYENLFCGYNPQRFAQFLCCDQYCDKHAIMCGEQACACGSDHHQCSFIAIQPFINQIRSKLQEPIPKYAQNYFSAKSVIYQHMFDRISQQRQALRDWKKDTDGESQKFLFLYGFDWAKTEICNGPKILYQQVFGHDHNRCGCLPLKISPKIQRSLNIKDIQNKICNKYSSILDYFDEQIDNLQFTKGCTNLNPGQFLFVNFLKNKDCFCIKQSEHQAFGLNKEFLKQIKIVPGRFIYYAMKQNKNSKNVSFDKFSVQRIREKWKIQSEKIFRLFVEGKAMNELFCLISQKHQPEDLQARSAQELRSYLCKINQSLNQGQDQLFSRSLLKKTKQFKNVHPKKLTKELKKYKGTKFDEIYITNYKYLAAVTDTQTIQELGNFINVTKLEIRWCFFMQQKISIEILNAMPNLKQLALLGYYYKLSKKFIEKLCQLRQLTLFYSNYYSNAKFYRNYSQDKYFMILDDTNRQSVLQIQQLTGLSKILKLQNIEILISSMPKVIISQMIKNIKSLKHLTLIDDSKKFHWNRIRQHTSLIKDLNEQRDLITLSLIELVIDSKSLDYIISNNPHLRTIIILSRQFNNNLNDKTIQCMTSLIQLQNLCVDRSLSITGKHLNKLNRLIMLEIVNCTQIINHKIILALQNMPSLKFLNLGYSNIIDDQVIGSVKQCKQLEFLSIKNTLVSGEGLKQLEGLKYLKTLICDNLHKVNGKDLIDLSKKIRTITKLSMNNLDVDDYDLLEISANCQDISHLDVTYTKITVEALLKLKHLKVVKGILDGESECRLRQKGVRTYHS